MPAAVLFLIFVLLLIIAIPVSITLGITSVLPSIFDPSFTVGAKYLIRAMFGGLDSFPLLAVPMFVLSGIVMAKGGISKKLFNVFAYFLGRFTAGMPCAVIVTCLFYGAISGSAPATVAAVGSMTIPILTSLGYDLTFSTAIVAVAGGLGVIIPPSIPFIMYGMHGLRRFCEQSVSRRYHSWTDDRVSADALRHLPLQTLWRRQRKNSCRSISAS